MKQASAQTPTVDLTVGTSKVPLFATFVAYREFVRRVLFPHSVFTDNKKISNLIDWIIYYRSPIFYFAKNEAERLAYFGCYGIIPVVHPAGPYLGYQNRYEDKVIVALTHLHEFVHNLFNYPYSLKDLTKRMFDNKMQSNEYAASNFSEVQAYFIIPELDELTKNAFFRPSWFDAIKERNLPAQPNSAQLMEWRKQWIYDPETWGEFFAPGEKYEYTRTYMDRFYNGNEDFNFGRMDSLMPLKGFKDPGLPSLDNIGFMETLEDFVVPYSEEEAQANYERVQMIHIDLLYKLLNLPNPPTSFSEALERQSELNEVEFILN